MPWGCVTHGHRLSTPDTMSQFWSWGPAQLWVGSQEAPGRVLLALLASGGDPGSWPVAASRQPLPPGARPPSPASNPLPFLLQRHQPLDLGSGLSSDDFISGLSSSHLERCYFQMKPHSNECGHGSLGPSVLVLELQQQPTCGWDAAGPFPRTHYPRLSPQAAVPLLRGRPPGSSPHQPGRGGALGSPASSPLPEHPDSSSPWVPRHRKPRPSLPKRALLRPHQGGVPSTVQGGRS